MKERDHETKQYKLANGVNGHELQNVYALFALLIDVVLSNTQPFICIPINSAGTNNPAFGIPAPNETIPGPGHMPASPHPITTAKCENQNNYR